MVFEAVRRNIKPLDFSAPHLPNAEEQKYFDFYSINFEIDNELVDHFFGALDEGSFDVACHYFRHKEALGTCYVVHGYFDHAGLFGHVIEYLLNAKQNVILIDLPGHGLSSGERATIDAFAQYVSVLDDCVKRSAVVRSNLPIHFLGQSTGAAVIMQYVLENRHADPASILGQVVLLAPLVRPAKWAFLKLVFPFVQRFVGDMPRTFSTNSHDKKFLDFLRLTDPLQFHSLPIQWVRAMSVWLNAFKRLPVSLLSPIVIQGQQDNTVDWRFNIKVIKEKFPGAQVHFVTEGRHHLANESELIRQKIFNYLDPIFAIRKEGNDAK